MSLNFDGLLTLEYTNPTEFTKQCQQNPQLK